MRLFVFAMVSLAALSTSAFAQTSRYDFRGISLGITREEFEREIARRGSHANCLFVDYARPDPDGYECSEDSDVAIYRFSADQSGDMRLRRIIVPGSLEDFRPFTEAVRRRYGAPTSRPSATRLRWTNAHGYVEVRAAPWCDEVISGMIYNGTCAVYVDDDLQLIFDQHRHLNQRREF